MEVPCARRPAPPRKNWRTQTADCERRCWPTQPASPRSGRRSPSARRCAGSRSPATTGFSPRRSKVPPIGSASYRQLQGFSVCKGALWDKMKVSPSYARPGAAADLADHRRWAAWQLHDPGKDTAARRWRHFHALYNHLGLFYLITSLISASPHKLNRAA